MYSREDQLFGKFRVLPEISLFMEGYGAYFIGSTSETAIVAMAIEKGVLRDEIVMLVRGNISKSEHTQSFKIRELATGLKILFGEYWKGLTGCPGITASEDLRFYPFNNLVQVSLNYVAWSDLADKLFSVATITSSSLDREGK